MVWQELHVGDLDVFLQAMELNTAVIVNVDILLLRDGEVLVVVKPPGVSYGLAELQFASQFALPPVHRGDMALSPR